MSTETHLKDNWALILGASSGFGEAVAIRLAEAGMHIFGIHLDRKSTMPNVERIIGTIKEKGRQAVFFNINASDSEKRRETIDHIEQVLKENQNPSGIKIMLHSLAFGTLKPYISNSPKEMVTESNMNMTLDVMAHSLVYWTQEIVLRNLMVSGGRIFAMTSAGGHRVWPTYGPVSASKAALEAHVRQLAVELAPYGITVNALRAGVTDTPALRKIPGHELIIEKALQANPSGRLTTPKDVAEAIVALSHPGTYWITGNVIGVDGGEDLI
ncbi:Enoyl-[acyl-carrier-protein] reductase [NADPH] FabL [bacterium HR37]|nr:Enoyl-[acyl-carrier-protein] reductase [NADPH] FabL [bacterium HR37]